MDHSDFIVYSFIENSILKMVEFMGESPKFPKWRTLALQIFKLAGCLQILIISCFNGQMCLDNLKINQRSYYNLPNSAF